MTMYDDSGKDWDDAHDLAGPPKLIAALELPAARTDWGLKENPEGQAATLLLENKLSLGQLLNGARHPERAAIRAVLDQQDRWLCQLAPYWFEYDERLTIAGEWACELWAKDNLDLERLAEAFEIEILDLEMQLCPVCGDGDGPRLCGSHEEEYYWSGPSYNSSDGLPTLERYR